MSETARLRWLCRRGMKELDLVLTRYLERRYADAPEGDQARFRQLREMADPDLYRLLLGRGDDVDVELQEFAQRLREIDDKN